MLEPSFKGINILSKTRTPSLLQIDDGMSNGKRSIDSVNFEESDFPLVGVNKSQAYKTRVIGQEVSTFKSKMMDITRDADSDLLPNT